MSLSSILSQILKKGKPVERNGPEKTTQTTSKTPNLAPSKKPLLASTSYSERPVDPVVARLKALRKAEIEKKEQERREKKGLQPKKIPSKVPMRTGPKLQMQPRKQTNGGKGRQSNGQAVRSSIPPVVQAPRKKVNFNELMKKAQLIDHSKLSIAPAIKQLTPPTKGGARSSGTTGNGAGFTSRNSISSRGGRNPSNGSTSDRNRQGGAGPSSRNGRPVTKAPLPEPRKPLARAPLPIRKPSSMLEKKLYSRKQTSAAHRDRGGRDDYYDDESDMDDFLVDDEEEDYGSHSQDTGYDRDEIWAIFNRGKKRSHYQYNDYDSDDMEATGAEILEEEDRSKKRAEYEDKKELEEEKRRALLKKARLQRG